MQHVVVVGARRGRIEHRTVVEVIHHPGRFHHVDGLMPLGFHHIAGSVGPGVFEPVGTQITSIRDRTARENVDQMRRPWHRFERPVRVAAHKCHIQQVASHIVAQLEVKHAVVQRAIDERPVIVARKLQGLDGRMLLQLFRQRAVVGLIEQEAVQCEGGRRDERDVRAVVVDGKCFIERLPPLKRRLALLRLRANNVTVASRQVPEARQSNGGSRHEPQPPLASCTRIFVGRVHLQPTDAGSDGGHSIARADVRQGDDGHVPWYQRADVGVQRIVGVFAHIVFPLRGHGAFSAVGIARQWERVANTAHRVIIGAILRGVEVHRGRRSGRASPRQRIVRFGEDLQLRIATGRGRPSVAEIETDKVAGDEPLHASTGSNVAHGRRLLVVVAVREVALVVPAEARDVPISNTIAVGVEGHPIGIRSQSPHFSCGIAVFKRDKRGRIDPATEASHAGGGFGHTHHCSRVAVADHNVRRFGVRPKKASDVSRAFDFAGCSASFECVCSRMNNALKNTSNIIRVNIDISKAIAIYPFPTHPHARRESP